MHLSSISFYLLLSKNHALNMIAYEHWHHVGRTVPSWFAFHVVVNFATVYFQSVEDNVFYLAQFVVTVDYRQIRVASVVADVAEGNVFYTLAWCGAVFLVVANLYMQYASLMDIFYSDVVEHHIFDIVVVATVYCHATLIVNLRFTLTKDVYIFVSQSDDAIANLRVAMDADEDWMGNVCPEGGIPHLYISHRTVETLSCGIGCGTIV